MGGMAFMMDMYDSEDSDDMFGDGEEYDSDEIEMIGKQMGLTKSELKELKKDLKLKYDMKQKQKAKEARETKETKQEEPASTQAANDDDWEDDSD